MLAPFEKAFLDKEVSDLPIQNIEAPALTQEEINETNELALQSINNMDDDMAREVYTAYLGYYSGRMPMLGQRRSAALTKANKFIECLGVTNIPHLSPRFLSQLGLSEGNYSRNNSRGSSGFGRGSNSRGGFNRDNDRGFSRGNNSRGSKSFDRDNSDRGSFNRRDSFSSSRRFEDRDGGYKSRDSFSSRDNGFKRRDSGFKSRDDGFMSRDDGFKSRDNFERRSNFKRREDYQVIHALQLLL